MTIEVLEPAWSGSMEARGEAPSLSGYIGRSSIYNCVGAKHELGRDVTQPPERPQRKRMADIPRELETAILERLKRGDSYNVIARACDVTRDTARKVGRWHRLYRVRVGSSNVFLTKGAA